MSETKINKERSARLLGIIVVAAITIYLLFQGASYNGGYSTGVSSSQNGNQYETVRMKGDSRVVVDPNTGLKYTTVDSGKYTGSKVKATFVTLARNGDLTELLSSIRSVEDRFNKKFQYDWVFLNDEEFTDDFKNTVASMISGNVKFGLIPVEHWSYPSWIDQEKAAQVRADMKAKKIIYGHSESYRHMCRYESGFFYRHKLMDEYEFYWRVEPGVKIYCDIDYDIFKFMKDNDKKYGFTISLREYEATIETLWKTVFEFNQANPQYLHKNNMMKFISDDNGASYNLCHFWSNFEVASLELWRSEAYTKFFDHLDHAGGFFYERWGDAPVHSIAASLFLDKNQIHHFNDVGYYHVPFHSCPVSDAFRRDHRCVCSPSDDFTWKSYSCTPQFYNVRNLKKPEGWQNFT
ncbi:Ktr1 [Kluyveromyces lactis]|nr:Ktr1 [Kluyveromyces lactis]